MNDFLRQVNVRYLRAGAAPSYAVYNEVKRERLYEGTSIHNPSGGPVAVQDLTLSDMILQHGSWERASEDCRRTDDESLRWALAAVGTPEDFYSNDMKP